MITIQVEGLSELREGLGRASNEVESLLSDAIRKSGEVTKQNVAREAPVFEGTLKRSISHLHQGLRSEVYVGPGSEKYGYVQEYGRRPGKQPPTQALEKWAKAKLGDSNLAFVVARSIGKKGTKPQPFFEPGIEESLAEIEKYLDQVGSKIINMI